MRGCYRESEASLKLRRVDLFFAVFAKNALFSLRISREESGSDKEARVLPRERENVRELLFFSFIFSFSFLRDAFLVDFSRGAQLAQGICVDRERANRDRERELLRVFPLILFVFFRIFAFS